MQNAEEIIDRYSGMITRSMAESMASSPDSESEIKADSARRNDTTDAAGIIQFAGMKRKVGMSLNRSEDAYTVNVEDTVYRVFNSGDRGKGIRRDIVIGREGATIRIILHGKIAEQIDTEKVCRGDKVLIRNVVLDPATMDLESRPDTSLMMTTQAKAKTVPLQELREGMKNVDISGKLAEVGILKQVSKLSGNGTVAVVNCTIRDADSPVSLILWESSANIASKMVPNDTVRIEFCSVRSKNGLIEIVANEYSRVLKL